MLVTNLELACPKSQYPTICNFFAAIILIFALALPSWGQQQFGSSSNSVEQNPQVKKEQLNVNWLYGAFVPKEAPLISLSGYQRERLFVRQSFTTPGIYVKSGFLALLAQARGEPYSWGGGIPGYGRRFASNYARTAIQNVFSTAGNAALRYEPRYDRCHCFGLGPRTRHALLRNFLTYDHTEEKLRPQFALYGAALGAGTLSSTWEPRSHLWKEGYESVLTQAAFGMLSNWVGEFAPEIRSQLEQKRILRSRPR
jgi:hypothetical protein